jgi:hypothetical protein
MESRTPDNTEISKVLGINEDLLRTLAKTEPQKFLRLVELYDQKLILAAREDPNVFIPYILKDERTGYPIQQEVVHRELQNLVTDHDRVVVWGHPGLGKCVTENTRFFLDSGDSVTLSELRTRLIAQGRAAILTVDPSTMKVCSTPVKEITYNGCVPCITVTTDGGYRCTTSDNHPYLVNHNGEHKWVQAKFVQAGDLVCTATPRFDGARALTLTRSVAEAYGAAVAVNLASKRIPITDPRAAHINFTAPPANHAGIEALFEGKGAKVRSHEDDGLALLEHTALFVTHRLGAMTYTESQGPVHYKRRVIQFEDGIRAQLESLDQASAYYFTVGFAKVLAQWVGDGKYVQLYTLTKHHSTDEYINVVMTLFRRAGFRLRVRRSGSSLKIAFRSGPVHALFADCLKTNPVLASKEGELLHVASDQSPEAEWERVARVAKAGDTDTWGVEVASPEHTHLTDGILTHNTQQLSIGRALWEIGKNHLIRICIIQGSKQLAKDVGVAIKQHIESNERFHKVFPHIKPGALWTNTEFSVDREGFDVKDPTVIVVGTEGNMLGKRLDLVIGDDFLNEDNTRTAYRRNGVNKWMRYTVLSRLERVTQDIKQKFASRIILIGNALHGDDFMHEAEKMGWKSVRYPVRDANGKPTFPKRWTEEAIRAAELEMGPIEAARSLYCKPRSDEMSRFHEDWFKEAIERGRGKFGTMSRVLHMLSEDNQATIVTGIDLGIRKKVGADYTAAVHWLMEPDGSRVLLAAERHHFKAHEILSWIVQIHERYHGRIFVESVQAQRFIVDLIEEDAPWIDIHPFFTRGSGNYQNKNSGVYGIEGFATSLSRGEVTIVASSDGKPGSYEGVDATVHQLIRDALYYSPKTGEHTADLLMAAWIGHAGLSRMMQDHGVAFIPRGYDDLGNAVIEHNEEQAKQAYEEAKRNFDNNAAQQIYRGSLGLGGGSPAGDINW